MADNKDKKVLNVPALRFPEFTGEWNFELLGIIAPNITSGKSKPSLGEYNLYGSTGVIGKTANADYFGDMLLVARVGANAGSLQLVNENCGITDNTLIIKPCKLSSHYLYFYLQHYNLNRLVFGSGQPLITAGMLKKVRIPFGNQLEQRKIERLLICIDERIATQNKIIEDLKKLKSAIVDKLYSSVNGETYSFRQLFDVVNERNKKLTYSNVLSASQELGMIERSDINIDIKFEQDSISKYKIVRRGDYVVHLRSFQGGFAFSDRTGICSPAYTILRPNDMVVYGYLSYFFTSKPFIKSLKLVTYGIRDGRSINVEEWLDMTVTLPTRQGQSHIIAIINAIDDKLNNENQIHTCLLQQRAFLLKVMFI